MTGLFVQIRRHPLWLPCAGLWFVDLIVGLLMSQNYLPAGVACPLVLSEMGLVSIWIVLGPGLAEQRISDASLFLLALCLNVPYWFVPSTLVVTIMDLAVLSLLRTVTSVAALFVFLLPLLFVRWSIRSQGPNSRKALLFRRELWQYHLDDLLILIIAIIVVAAVARTDTFRTFLQNTNNFPGHACVMEVLLIGCLLAIAASPACVVCAWSTQLRSRWRSAVGFLGMAISVALCQIVISSRPWNGISGVGAIQEVYSASQFGPSLQVVFLSTLSLCFKLLQRAGFSLQHLLRFQ